MRIPFFKMEAQGNDYIYIDQAKVGLELDELIDLSIRISDRHFGIGSDGLVTFEVSKIADVKMRIFNADGSEAEMCGSALRSLVSYICKERDVTKLTVETNAGIKDGFINANGYVEVNMGKVKVEDTQINIEDYAGYFADVGNPHFVTFDQIDYATFIRIAPLMETFRLEGRSSRNIEFVKIITPQNVKVNVWERGSGITLACGTGATAVMAVGRKLGLLKNDVEVGLPGGVVTVKYKEDIDNYYLCGNVNYVFDGIYYY